MLNTTLITLTRAEIERAIRVASRWGGDGDEPVTGDLRDQYGGYEDYDFEATVEAVCAALVDGPLADTHEVCMNFTWESADHTTSGGQVEIPLPEGGYLAAGWHELKHLTHDRGATGIDGLVAIAEALIDHANASIRLAQQLITAQTETAQISDPLHPAHGTEEYTLTWTVSGDGTSPADAAARVWREVLRRGPWQPNDDETCIFHVTGENGSAQVDLSDERFAYLFAQTGS